MCIRDSHKGGAYIPPALRIFQVQAFLRDFTGLRINSINQLSIRDPVNNDFNTADIFSGCLLYTSRCV